MNEWTKAAAYGLRRFRMAAHLSQTELARLCGVSRSTVIRWEDPRISWAPSLIHLQRMAAQLRQQPEELARQLLEDA